MRPDCYCLSASQARMTNVWSHSQKLDSLNWNLASVKKKLKKTTSNYNAVHYKHRLQKVKKNVDLYEVLLKAKGKCLHHYHPLAASMETKEHRRRFPVPAPGWQHADDLSATLRAPVWQQPKRGRAGGSEVIVRQRSKKETSILCEEKNRKKKK